MGSREFEALEQTLQKVSEDLKVALKRIKELEEENNYLRLKIDEIMFANINKTSEQSIMKGRIFAVGDAPCSNNVHDYDM